MHNDDLKLILDTQFSAVRATIMAEAEVQNLKIDTIVEHQKWQNGQLQDHHKSIDELEKSDSGRMAVKKTLGKYFVRGCAIIAAAGTIITVLLAFK